MSRLCECGCGQVVKSGNRFIQGHNSRGRILTKEHKEKIRKGNKNKIVTEETKEKLRIAQTGKTYSEESKAKMSRSHIGQAPSSTSWKKGNVPWNRGKKSRLSTIVKLMRPRIDGYCDAWSDEEYKNDLRKGACEECGITNMMSIHLFGFILSNHHENGKENCSPDDIRTLCHSCHMSHHMILRHKKMRAEGGY
jgi:hypothetical protein